jgi:hypothetical protein
MIDDGREAAWIAYQEGLGNLTQRERLESCRAFYAGWAAAVLKAQLAREQNPP